MSSLSIIIFKKQLEMDWIEMFSIMPLVNYATMIMWKLQAIDAKLTAQSRAHQQLIISWRQGIHRTPEWSSHHLDNHSNRFFDKQSHVCTNLQRQKAGRNSSNIVSRSGLF